MADIYQTSDYTDWWTKMYGNTANNGTVLSAPVKTDTMSDANYRIGQQLYNSYKQGMQYQNDYDTAVAASKTAMENAKIEADVSRQRLEKYLPQQLAMQGLYGTGMSEDAYLRLQNQYQKAVSDANATHNANLNTYKSALDSQKHTLWQQTTDGVNKIVDDEKDEQNRIKTEQEAAWTKGIDLLYSATTLEELDAYYAAYEGKIPEDMRTAFKTTYNTMRADFEQEKAAIEEEQGRTTEYRASVEGGPTYFLGNGKNLEVKINNKSYTVEADVEISENDAAHIYAVTNNNVQHKQFFKYDGEIYVRFNDTVHKILSVDDDTNSADYRALMDYLTTGQVIDTEKSTPSDAVNNTVSALNPNYLEQQYKNFKKSSPSAANR